MFVGGRRRGGDREDTNHVDEIPGLDFPIVGWGFNPCVLENVGQYVFDFLCEKGEGGCLLDIVRRRIGPIIG